MCKKKNILFIKNIIQDNKLDYLDKYFSVNITWINSIELIGKDYWYLNNMIKPYDIIIMGGGPQHIIGNYENVHPEIKNQIELVKIISHTDKLLIGICLGCQIIGKAFGYSIIQMNNLCKGFNYLDSNSIDYNLIQTKNDKYLSRFDWKLLAKSFSYHYDCVNINTCNNFNCKLRCVGYSKLNIPYIFSHSDANIYGFQFHPEITIGRIKNVLDNNNDTLDDNDTLDKKVTNNIFKEQIKSDLDKFNSDICMHFFDVFINS
jgi:anthranilate/para-aminobenzoate synthase component II